MIDAQKRRQIVAHLIVAGGALLVAKLLPGRTGIVKTLAVMAAAEGLHQRFDTTVEGKLAELGL